MSVERRGIVIGVCKECGDMFSNEYYVDDDAATAGGSGSRPAVCTTPWTILDCGHTFCTKCVDYSIKLDLQKTNSTAWCPACGNVQVRRSKLECPHNLFNPVQDNTFTPLFLKNCIEQLRNDCIWLEYRVAENEKRSAELDGVIEELEKFFKDKDPERLRTYVHQVIQAETIASRKIRAENESSRLMAEISIMKKQVLPMVILMIIFVFIVRFFM